MGGDYKIQMNMRQLKYVEVNPNGYTYSSFPYYCTTNTKIVFKYLNLPVQPNTGRGCNAFCCGVGRFQGSGDCMECVPAGTGGQANLTYGYYHWAPQTAYFEVSYGGVIEGEVEFGNAYIKVNGSVVATGTTYTGNTVTLVDKPFYLFSHWHWAHNYVISGQCGQVLFYENGVLAATFTPYEDDNGRAGFLNEANQTMIYSLQNDWVAGPDAGITAKASKSSLAATGETINIAVECEDAWTLTTSGESFLTLSSTGDTGSTTITATAPNYTGTTPREEYIIFTDTVTGDEAEVKIKQKKYSTGQPFYLGADEIVEIYLGDDSITEAYLGENLVFQG